MMRAKWLVLGCIFPFIFSCSCKQQINKEAISTIDSTLQVKVTEILDNKLSEIDALSGQVIIMETQTGQIKAMVGIEYADTLKYGKSDDIFSYREESPLMLTVSLLVALESGKVKLTDKFDITKGDSLLNTEVFPRNDGVLTIGEGLKSCSRVLTIKVIQQVYSNDPETFYTQLDKMSYGEPSYWEAMPNLKPITIVKPNHEAWKSSVLSLGSLGYYQRIAPIQTLTFFNAIANNGKMVQPLLKKDSVQVINAQIASEANLGNIRSLLSDSTLNAIYQSASVQVREDKHNYSLCGYFPADNPQYTIIVSINAIRNTGGGLIAGDVFREIVDYIRIK